MRPGVRPSPPSVRRTAAALAVAASLSTASPAAAASGPGSADAWLHGVENRLVGLSGLPIDVRAPSDGLSRRYVIYAPLATVWLLAESGAEVRRAGSVRAVSTEQGRFVAVFWGKGEIASLGWPDLLPEIVAAGERLHPLAVFHDRLLSSALAAPLGNLPAGSRFVPVVVSGPGGIVERPDSPERVTLWESFGDLIAISHPDGNRTVHGWREVDAVLEGGAE